MRRGGLTSRLGSSPRPVPLGVEGPRGLRPQLLTGRQRLLSQALGAGLWLALLAHLAERVRRLACVSADAGSGRPSAIFWDGGYKPPAGQAGYVKWVSRG